MEEVQQNNYEQMLRMVNIRVTAIRLMVLKVVHTRFSGAFSLQDVVDELQTADHSSVFRALTLFAERDMLHLIDDGSGVQKYCVCHCEDRNHHQGHVHFTCRCCHRTYCLTDVPIPEVSLPDGFDSEESEYVIKGVCADCRTSKL